MTKNHDDDDDDASTSSSSSSSRKRFKNFDHNGVASWSDVNHDVLFLVMMRLGFIDFFAFSGVCKSWRSFALSNRNTFMASKPPMKISIEPREDSYCCLEDFKEQRFKTILPHSCDRICFGLTCGYLVLFGRETRDFWLVNPITKHELHFPYYPLYVAARIKKLRTILVFAPSISRWVFVLLHKKISFSVAGNNGWHHISSTCIRDLQYFKGKIYTLHNDFSLRELRLGLRQKHKWILLKPKNFPNPKLFNSQFVSSGENLYVMSHSGLLPKKIIELDFGEMKWVLPDKTTYAFFIGNRNYSAAFKLGSWADLQTQHKSSEYFLGNDKSRKCMFFYEQMWYFPHDCFNVNRFDD